MYESAKQGFLDELAEMRAQGVHKDERVIVSRQGPALRLADGREVLNFCANNYLGLASHPSVIAAAHAALDRWGYGLSSVRFICGTQKVHKDAERKISEFLGTDDTVLFGSCFDANLGVFAPLLDERDAIIADRLNHASIIDGVRSCKARRLIYEHVDLDDLDTKLAEAASARRRLVVTDGVFSMDGDVAPLDRICDAAERHGALVMVDDSHATGFIGPTGRGTPELFGCAERVDLVSTTFGKALGGASGGCVSGRRELVDLVRQRARPYVFSNSVAPVIAGTTIAVMDILSESSEWRDRLTENATLFRAEMRKAGLAVREGTTPIVPVMLYNTGLANGMAHDLYDEGIYVVGFTYPVVPLGRARIRVQLSAAHAREHVDRCVAAFRKVGERYGVLGLDEAGILAKFGA
jgi:glycine C-acetyltransferase